MTTQTHIPNSNPDTPRVSFTAYPLGAWLMCVLAATVFLALSHHEERIAIWQIFIAGSIAVATVGGTLYAMVLLALKRYPSFKASFYLGLVVAALCTAAGVAMAFVLNQPPLSFAMMGVFLLISTILPFFIRKNKNVTNA